MTTRDSNLAVARLFEEIAQSLEPRHVWNTLPLDELRSQLLPRFGR